MYRFSIHRHPVALAKALLLIAGSPLAYVPAAALAQEAPKPVDGAAPATDEAQSSADTSTASASPDASDPDASDIVVTGSRIRGVGPVGSNVISVGQAALTQTTAVTANDILKQVPQIVSSGYDATNYTPTAGSGNGNITRAGSVNIHGLGPQATLVIFDGLRMVNQGPGANYVDPQTIPAIAIERIEIVPDGASAIYGSDAVAGVVNFVPRKNVNGLEVRGRLNAADDYLQEQASAIAGKRWAGGSAVLAYEFTHNSSLNGAERGFFRSDQRAFGGSDYRGTQCNPGNVVIAGVTYPVPGAVSAATLVPGPANRCDYLSAQDILPRQTAHSAYGRIEQQLTSGISAYVEATWSKRDLSVLFTAQGSSSEFANLTVPRTNAFFVAPTGLNPATETVQYSFVPQLGALRATGGETTLNLNGGLDFKLPGNWAAHASGFYGRNRSETSNPALTNAALTAALASANPATALDPYGLRTDPAVLTGIFSSVFNPIGRNLLAGGAVRADGALFGLPGGDVRLAIGGEYDHYALDSVTLRGLATAPAGVPVKFERDVKSAFAELFVPIFGAGNAVPGIDRLELSAAIRTDDYSDVGSTTNPKIGLNWTPVEGVKLRGSYGTSFRAPFLPDTSPQRPGTTTSVVTYSDPLSPTGTSVGLVLQTGNPTVSPEDAETFSLGVEFQPIRSLRFGVTYFNIDYSGQIISQANNTLILQQAALYGALITRNPTAAQVAATIAASGGVSTGVIPAAPAFIVDGRPANLGSTKVQGFDFELAYRFELGRGRVDLNVNGARYVKYESTAVAGGTLTDRLGTLFYPVKFKARANLGYQSDIVEANAFLNYTGSYRNTGIAPAQPIGDFATVDLHLGIKPPVLRNLVPDWTLSLDVTNVGDSRPPFVNIAGGYDPSQASALGRIVAIGLRTKW